MAATHDSIETFLQFYRRYILHGDEQNERSQGAPFLEAFFQAFGHAGTRQAGAILEKSIPEAGRRGRTGYADLYWPRGSVLVELKRRSERRLDRHYGQVWDYVSHLNPPPRYAVLCNFDEFWIYDFEQAIGTPVDKIRTEEIGFHLDAFRFMEGSVQAPLFRDGQIVEVTKAAAETMGELYQALHHRSQSPSTHFNEQDAQRFVLQCVLALFSEYRQLLPDKAFSKAVAKCLPPQPESTYDILCKGLFREMNEAGRTPYGQFQGVRYFNGGLFATLPPIELDQTELLMLDRATRHNWSKVRPAIFGSIFEATLATDDRHTEGIHFTSENDIMKIVRPTIGQYWEEQIDATNTLADLNALHLEMQRYRVLDPACGSGNFLYMAYQELKQVEQLLIDKIFSHEQNQTAQTRRLSGINLEQQFFGLDRNAFAVELARVTLSIARKVAVDSLGLDEAVLPLDTLDHNIIRCDALKIDEWPEADAIIGNPPFQSKNKMQREFGVDYIRELRQRYPDIPGRADYCVYWFRRAHDRLKQGGRAGLVGTNTIRQNYSRQGGLDYIVETGGTIFNAVSSQVWSGEAAVHVSLVNWVKGEYNAPKILATQLGDSRESPWRYEEGIEAINSALSSTIDLSQAQVLAVNRQLKCCYQGQTHGHDGFLINLEHESVSDWDQKSLTVLHPYLNANELLGNYANTPTRYLIDLSFVKTEKTAKTYTSAFAIIRDRVLPTMRQNAQQERQAIQKRSGPRQSHLKKWWCLWRSRPDLLQTLGTMDRYIACARVTKRPIFEFVSTEIRPNDALQVFTFEDDYSFGILQSSLHWAWFTHRCSTLTARFRYTSQSVFDTFPWPQDPTIDQVTAIASAAADLRQLRHTLMQADCLSLRDLYRTLDLPGETPLHHAHAHLDAAVRAAYGLDVQADPLAFLLALNQAIARREALQQPVTAPGLPSTVPQ
jgi:hypothetical protein